MSCGVRPPGIARSRTPAPRRARRAAGPVTRRRYGGCGATHRRGRWRAPACGAGALRGRRRLRLPGRLGHDDRRDAVLRDRPAVLRPRQHRAFAQDRGRVVGRRCPVARRSIRRASRSPRCATSSPAASGWSCPLARRAAVDDHRDRRPLVAQEEAAVAVRDDRVRARDDRGRGPAAAACSRASGRWCRPPRRTRRRSAWFDGRRPCKRDDGDGEHRTGRIGCGRAQRCALREAGLAREWRAPCALVKCRSGMRLATSATAMIRNRCTTASPRRRAAHGRRIRARGRRRHVRRVRAGGDDAAARPHRVRARWANTPSRRDCAPRSPRPSSAT